MFSFPPLITLFSQAFIYLYIHIGTDRTTLQFDNNYSNAPLSSPPRMRKFNSGKFNRESGGMSIGTPLKQPSLNVSLSKSSDMKIEDKTEEKSQNLARTSESEPFKTGNIYVYIYVYICTYTYIYIYIYMHILNI
jgi:hypothetical protein